MRSATDDRQAPRNLEEHWAGVLYEEQKVIGRQLRTWGYEGTPVDALCEWGFERLHFTRSGSTCLRPVRRARAGSPTARPACPNGGRENQLDPSVQGCPGWGVVDSQLARLARRALRGSGAPLWGTDGEALGQG